MEKKRRPLVTKLLALFVLLFGALAVYLISYSDIAIWMFADETNAKIFFYIKHDMVNIFINSVLSMGILAVLSAVGIILVIKWKKIGWWIVLVASALSLIIDCYLLYHGGNTVDGVAICAFSILSPIIIWAILQIKEDGVSCWKQLG